MKREETLEQGLNMLEVLFKNKFLNYKENGRTKEAVCYFNAYMLIRNVKEGNLDEIKKFLK